MNEDQPPLAGQGIEPSQGWKRHFATSTPFSKYLALVCLIALPFVGFWVGMKYETGGEPMEIGDARTNPSLQQEVSDSRMKESAISVKPKEVFRPEELLKGNFVSHSSRAPSKLDFALLNEARLGEYGGTDLSEGFAFGSSKIQVPYENQNRLLMYKSPQDIPTVLFESNPEADSPTSRVVLDSTDKYAFIMMGESFAVVNLKEAQVVTGGSISVPSIRPGEYPIQISGAHWGVDGRVYLKGCAGNYCNMNQVFAYLDPLDNWKQHSFASENPTMYEYLIRRAWRGWTIAPSGAIGIGAEEGAYSVAYGGEAVPAESTRSSVLVHDIPIGITTTLVTTPGRHYVSLGWSQDSAVSFFDEFTVIPGVGRNKVAYTTFRYEATHAYIKETKYTCSFKSPDLAYAWLERGDYNCEQK
jgi:hypothetical protein